MRRLGHGRAAATQADRLFGRQQRGERAGERDLRRRRRRGSRRQHRHAARPADMAMAGTSGGSPSPGSSRVPHRPRRRIERLGTHERRGGAVSRRSHLARIRSDRPVRLSGSTGTASRRRARRLSTSAVARCDAASWRRTARRRQRSRRASACGRDSITTAAARTASMRTPSRTRPPAPAPGHGLEGAGQQQDRHVRSARPRTNVGDARSRPPPACRCRPARCRAARIPALMARSPSPTDTTRRPRRRTSAPRPAGWSRCRRRAEAFWSSAARMASARRALTLPLMKSMIACIGRARQEHALHPIACSFGMSTSGMIPPTSTAHRPAPCSFSSSITRGQMCMCAH